MKLIYKKNDENVIHPDNFTRVRDGIAWCEQNLELGSKFFLIGSNKVIYHRGVVAERKEIYKLPYKKEDLIMSPMENVEKFKKLEGLMNRTGWGANKIAAAIGITTGRMSGILRHRRRYSQVELDAAIAHLEGLLR